MKVTVLLASGVEDAWEDVEANLETGGALALYSSEGRTLVAVYATGMWMKYEIE